MTMSIKSGKGTSLPTCLLCTATLAGMEASPAATLAGWPSLTGAATIARLFLGGNAERSGRAGRLRGPGGAMGSCTAAAVWLLDPPAALGLTEEGGGAVGVTLPAGIKLNADFLLEPAAALFELLCLACSALSGLKPPCLATACLLLSCFAVSFVTLLCLADFCLVAACVPLSCLIPSCWDMTCLLAPCWAPRLCKAVSEAAAWGIDDFAGTTADLVANLVAVGTG